MNTLDWSLESILIKSFNDKIYITPLKLNCLVYLLYSEYLYLNSRELFNEKFIKTEEGPIICSIYQKFNSYENNVIKSYAKDAKGKILYVQSEKFNDYLTRVWERYKNKSEENILSYIESGYGYSNKNKDEELEERDILKDMISRKKYELEEAKSYLKKLKLSKKKIIIIKILKK